MSISAYTISGSKHFLKLNRFINREHNIKHSISIKFNTATFFINEIFYVSLNLVLNNKSMIVINKSNNNIPEHENRLAKVIIMIIVANLDSL